MATTLKHSVPRRADTRLPAFALLLSALLATLLPATQQARADETSRRFDLSRAQLSDTTLFVPFRVASAIPLAEALKAGKLADGPATDLLVLDHPDGRVALITQQMAYHHVASGHFDGHPWMATFCVVCNSGVGMTPVLDGHELTFEVGGLYDGIPLLKDAECGSYWNHITGECVHGPLVGNRLPTFNLLHMTARRALERYPDLAVAISDVAPWPKKFTPYQESPKMTQIFEGFMRGTMGPEDTRRPTLDLGLGVWTAGAQRYYPVNTIAASGGVIDRLDGRNVLIYLDPQTNTPAALFTDAKSLKWNEGDARLDNGETIRDGVLYASNGHRVAVERPLQMFTRWYGFAYTFPGCSVYENAN